MALSGAIFEAGSGLCTQRHRFSVIFPRYFQYWGNSVRLKDKVALVTGAGRGIGRDIALAYAREGAHVVINDVDPATADATAKDAAALGSKSLAVVADIAKSADINRLVDAIIKERGRIDIVVNNAMKIVPGKLELLPEAAWDTTMNIGLKGAFLVSQAAANHMIAQKSGVIVNIASIADSSPTTGLVPTAL